MSSVQNEASLHAVRSDDEQHLRDAIALAQAARAGGNHPFGAVIVVDGNVIARAQNSVVTGRDATAHAEMNALRMAAAGSTQLSRATIYASTEPCVMCSGAIYWAGIERVVYACSSGSLARLAGESLLVPCRHIFDQGAREIVVIGPLLEDEGTTPHHGFW
jgi:tRNA(Arg) A34 adenosine deaminase TadA